MSLRSTVLGWLGRGARERPTLQESPANPVAVCECNAWRGFMVEVLYPDAVRIQVAPGDAASLIVNMIPRTTRGVLVHLNASLTRGFIDSEAELRAALTERGQRVLNLDAVDIRKSALHEACAATGVPSARAEREGPKDERLIVKTRLNYSGRPERALREQWGSRAAPFTVGISDVIRAPDGYLIKPRAEVPAGVWNDPALVIERFIENPEGIYFRVYLAGPAGVVSAVWVDGDIKKLSVGIKRRRNYYFWTDQDHQPIALGPSNEQAACALALTRRVAVALHLDFVGADCVLDGHGQVVIIDANKTPYWGEPRQSPILSHLRHGFDALIGDFT